MTENHPSDNPSPPRRKRPWARIIGVAAILVAVALGVWAGIWYHRFKQNLKARNCPYTLEEIGLICNMWESENYNRWPRLSELPGEFMFSPDEVSKVGDTLREYIPGMSNLTCPSTSNAHSEEFPGDATYVYFGPGLKTEEEAIAFLDAYLKAALAGQPLPTPEYDIDAYESMESAKMYELLHAMPVVFDRPQNHDFKYINILFANGAVESRKMGTRYPATKSFWDKLERVEAAIQEANLPQATPKAPTRGAPDSNP